VNSSRTLTLLSAAVLAAAAVWIALHTYWDDDVEYKPPQGDAASNRYYSFEKLSGRFSIQSTQVSLLRTLPSTDHVLIVDDLRGSLLHIDALEQWVANGGRLLLSGSALTSNPKLRSWSGIGLAAPDSAAAQPASGDLSGAADPDKDCTPYLERRAGRDSGESLHGCLGYPQVAYSSMHTPAWSLSNGYGFQMLRVNIGKGSVAVIACECLMGNKSLLRADHARIVFDAIPLRSGDRVDIFNPKTAEGFLAMLWRLAAAAIVCLLAVLGLIIWRNLPRFGRIPEPPPPLRRSLAEQIRARARFAWRTRRLASLRRAESEALVRTADRKLAFFQRMDAPQRIAALAAHTGLESGALRDALSETLDGDAESQRAAIVLLEKARRQLSSQVFKSKVREHE